MEPSELFSPPTPKPEHFSTEVACVLFDEDETSISPPIQGSRQIKTILSRISKLLSGMNPKSLSSAVPLLRGIDRDIYPLCDGQTRREILTIISEEAPRVIAVMPNASIQHKALSRALFLSGVLNSEALTRIEKAIMAEKAND